MIAVDTNVLVYAHRRESPHHSPAVRALQGLVESDRQWGIPWPCVHEFVAVVSHPKVYVDPTPSPEALAALRDLLASGSGLLIGETDRHLPRLGDLLTASGVQGPKVHDARVAAICLDHGVDELWSADRDFSFFPALRTRNPLVARDT